MKKFMILIVFVGFASFANANKLLVKKTEVKIKTELQVNNLKETQVKVEVKKLQGEEQWEWSYTCGGIIYTGCCYGTQEEALTAGNINYASNSNC